LAALKFLSSPLILARLYEAQLPPPHLLMHTCFAELGFCKTRESKPLCLTPSLRDSLVFEGQMRHSLLFLNSRYSSEILRWKERRALQTHYYYKILRLFDSAPSLLTPIRRGSSASYLQPGQALIFLPSHSPIKVRPFPFFFLLLSDKIY